MSFASTFSSNEKLVGTGVKHTAVVGGVRMFKRETSEEAGQQEDRFQFKCQDQPKCQAACNLIMYAAPSALTPHRSCPILAENRAALWRGVAESAGECRRLVRGNSMFSVPPTRPELPIISMPMMVGDAGGFLPRSVSGSCCGLLTLWLSHARTQLWRWGVRLLSGT